MEKNSLPIIAFEDGGEFADWLLANHDSQPGVWVRMYKKRSGTPTVVWAEAVEAALCYGWIDGIANKLDDESYIQRFTQRRPRSIWSKKNRETAERLIAKGRMHAAGLREVERAKADGRWDRAYDSPKDMQVPQDFLDELDKHPEAKEFYATLNKTNRYAIAFRLHDAKKPETRARRMTQFIAMLAEGRKLH